VLHSIQQCPKLEQREMKVRFPFLSLLLLFALLSAVALLQQAALVQAQPEDGGGGGGGGGGGDQPPPPDDGAGGPEDGEEQPPPPDDGAGGPEDGEEQPPPPDDGAGGPEDGEEQPPPPDDGAGGPEDGEEQPPPPDESDVGAGGGEDQPPPTDVEGGDDECEANTDCDDCVSAGCGWAVGTCLSDCNIIADAACYSTATWPNEDDSPKDICQVEEDRTENYEACASQTSCSDCVGTSLPSQVDGRDTCMWFADAGGFCLPGCGQMGCGVDECTSEEPTPDEDTDSTTGGGECTAEDFCGGFAGFQCECSCSDANQHVECLDDPTDDCDPEQGGADCSGICTCVDHQQGGDAGEEVTPPPDDGAGDASSSTNGGDDSDGRDGSETAGTETSGGLLSAMERAVLPLFYSTLVSLFVVAL